MSTPAAASVGRCFRRSVNLERDFYRRSTRGLDGYVVTPKARELVARRAGALAAPGRSPRRRANARGR